jgi:DNA-binding MarR family transcriptional regulator
MNVTMSMPGSPALDDANTATLISLAHLLVSRRVGEAVAAAGHPVRPSHGAVFSQLGPDGARLTDLARVAQMSPQAMGELVDELEGLGYVERRPDPSDRRAKLIVLTPAGRRCGEAGGRAIAELERHITDTLGERGHRDLRRMLRRLLEQG